MRIGFLATEFVTERIFAGGLSNYLYRISRILVKQGHEVHVITFSYEKGESTFVHDGIIVHRVRSGYLRGLLNRLFLGKAPLTSLWLDFSYRAFHCLRRLHHKAPFDLLQYPNIHGSGLFSIFFLRVPYVIRISSYAPSWNKLQNRHSFDHRLCEMLEKIQLRIAHNIFAPSAMMKRLIKEKLGIDINIIPTPFFDETEKFDKSVYIKHLEGKPYILFFAKMLSSHKGPQVMANALPKIMTRHPDLMVVFVGYDNPYNGESMRGYIRTVCMDFEEKLLFFDPMPHSQLYPIIQHAEVVVLPSLIDNLPNTCLEAMGLGSVVIGTMGTSLDEVIVDGENGFLVTAGDAKHLEYVLLKVLAMDKRTQIGQAAQDAIKKNSREKVVSQLETYYSKIIHNAQSGSIK